MRKDWQVGKLMMSVNENNFLNTLARFRRGYTALFALIDDYPEELRHKSGALGEWTPQQILMHLSSWIDEAHQQYETFDTQGALNGRSGPPQDFAALDSASVDARDGQSWDDTVNELRDAVSRFIERAVRIETDRASADPRYEEWLMGLWNDCIEHMGHLIKFSETHNR